MQPISLPGDESAIGDDPYPSIASHATADYTHDTSGFAANSVLVPVESVRVRLVHGEVLL
jgi:hypothetical protein